MIFRALLLGFRIEYSSPYLVILCFVMLMTLFLVMIYLQANWSLSNADVVAEAKMEFDQGKEMSCFCLSFFLWLLSAAFGWITSYSPLVIGLDHNCASSD